MDETARILTEGGRPVAIAEYAIHQAHRMYAGAIAGDVADEVRAAARLVRQQALKDALAEFDAAKGPGEYETFPIRQARTLTRLALAGYRERMTPDNVWPAAHSAADAAASLGDVVDPGAEVLRWKSNGRCMHDDLLAAWLVLGLISEDQAIATSDAQQGETAVALAAYRANPPVPDAEQLHEMRAAFGPGAEVVDVISGQAFRV